MNYKENKIQQVTLLGSTGSIGRQTLDIIRDNRDLFEVNTLTANRGWEELAKQAIEFAAETVVIGDESLYQPLCERLSNHPIKVYAGSDAIRQVAGNTSVDVVVNALVGYAGLHPTVAAIEAGKKVALANKESLVVGGEYVMRLARERRVPIIPIDSEHSAIFQCLMGESSPIRKVILTCSGGSFRDLKREELANVTVEQALKHPKWSMGAKITIDSSTLVNKGFEVIEAYWLFGVEVDQIEVLQHRESIIHSMVEFEDGAIKAQLGTPDMRMPISLALMFPKRANRPDERFNFLDHPTLSFEAVDRVKYPALEIAYETLRRGGTASCTLNGANEIAVATFLEGRCSYLDIVKTIEHTLSKATFTPKPTLDDYAEANTEARRIAAEYLSLK
ncbi:MAG: 1-deoxy-D-xylulose-5-phosphate reductoisomerase [Rikenellaceae bacterium]